MPPCLTLSITEELRLSNIILELIWSKAKTMLFSLKAVRPCSVWLGSHLRAFPFYRFDSCVQTLNICLITEAFSTRIFWSNSKLFDLRVNRLPRSCCIRCGSRVSGATQGNELHPTHILRYSSYWRGSLQVAFNDDRPTYIWSSRFP